MSRGFPSMTALLGLIATAGYQNRTRSPRCSAGRLRAVQAHRGDPSRAIPAAELGGIAREPGRRRRRWGARRWAGRVGRALPAEWPGRRRKIWVGPGPNKEVAPNQLEQAMGPDVLATLSQQTGLSREEILARLSRELPQAVDKYTPEGRLPTQQDLSRWG